MKRWLIAYLLVFTLAAPQVTAQAQAPLEIERLQVDIWPEYDRAEVLIIYRIIIAPTSGLPAQVSLRIPRIANAPYNLAMKDVDGMLYNLKYDQVVEGDWLRVSFTAAATEIQLEYYDPRLVITGAQRQFEFYWPGDYRVRNMLLHIQRPINATDLKMTQGSLKIDQGLLAEDGLTYYTVPIDGQVEANTQFRAGFSYTKPDSALTSSQSPVQPVRTATNNTFGLDSSSHDTFVIGSIGLVVLLAAAVTFWYYNRQRRVQAAQANNRHHRHSRAAPEPAVKAKTVEAIYCHQCGKRAGPGDTFCRSCGARLKGSSQ